MEPGLHKKNGVGVTFLKKKKKVRIVTKKNISLFVNFPYICNSLSLI